MNPEEEIQIVLKRYLEKIVPFLQAESCRKKVEKMMICIIKMVKD